MNRNWSEDDLLRFCRDGDPAAWAELVRLRGKLVYGAIYGVLEKYALSFRADIADDVYARVFSECWEKGKLASVRDAHSLRTYLVALAVSRTVDTVRPVMRSHRRSVGADEASLTHTEDSRPGPAEDARRRDAREIVERELENLTQKEAYILRLSVQQGLTHEEIASLMRIPINTISTVIRRAREKIRESLTEKGISEC